MDNGYRIAEVAERSGFSAPTLRYYEEIGLLPAPGRTKSGYRVYDEKILYRLGFIARAKQLGCTLEETADLAAAWDAGTCGPVQSRLRAVVSAKRGQTQNQIAELTAFAAELQRTEAAMGAHTAEGACDDQCGCVSSPSIIGADPGLNLLPMVEPSHDPVVAIACTIQPDAMPGRVEEWRSLPSRVSSRSQLPNGIRLEFLPEVSAAEVARLAAAEHECCNLFSFSLTIESRGMALEVSAPAEAEDLVSALFGAA